MSKNSTRKLMVLIPLYGLYSALLLSLVLEVKLLKETGATVDHLY